MLHERPLDRLLRAININALAILSRGVEQAADDAGVHIGVFEFDVRCFHREG